MKKVLSFVLVLSMVLGSFGMAFAATPSDTVGKDCAEAVTVLTELGVVSGYKDGTYKPESIVTRAEMATLIVKALGLNDYAVGTSKFSDMKGNWADAYVGYANSLGIISGYSDGTFRGNLTVTYDQAITMLIQALGYTTDSLTGTYPTAFVTKAKALGMLDGIKSGPKGANRGDIAIMIYNTLSKEIGTTAKKDGNWTATKNDTMLQRLGATLYNGGAEFIVDGAQDVADGVNIKNYLGAKVTAYQNDDDEIIAVKEVKSTFIKGEFNKAKGLFVASDDTEYKLDKLTTATAIVFKNTAVSGAAVAATTLATNYDAVDVTVAAKVSGKYLTEIHSLSVWNAETPIKWTKELAKELADDDKLNGKEFEMTNKDKIDKASFSILGVASLDDIKEGNVVTVYMKSTKIARIAVGTEVVTGKVTKISSGSDQKATINGKTYKGNGLSIGSDVKLDDEGKFFLDYDGKIAFKEATSSADDYAIVLKEAGKDSSYESDIQKMKLLTADGAKTIYTIDEDYYKDKSASIAAITSKVAVAYSTNAKGQLEIIEASTMLGAQGKKLTSKGYFAGIQVADAVTVFKIDADGDFSVGSLKDVPVNEAFAQADTKYVTNKDGDRVDVIILGNGEISQDSTYAAVSGYGTVKNSDGKTVKEVTLFVNGKEVVQQTTSNGTAVTADKNIYKVSFSGAEIEKLTVVTASGVHVTSGAVEKINNGNLRFSTTGGYLEISPDVAVYKVNKDDNGLELSSFSKIAKGDDVTMYETDVLDGKDDKNGYDIIVFKAN